jgi:Flp pilus assembly protein TadG
MFFFEKKNQKTFGPGPSLSGKAAANMQKFFASFFQKRSPSSNLAERSSMLSNLARCRRGAVSVLFATGVVPMIGICGLAVDYGMWAEIHANLNDAVNTAALNAVKIAAAGEIANDPNYVSEGVVAGDQWFLTQAISTEPTLNVNGGSLSVTITGTTTITAKVTYYNGQIRSIFGHLFGKNYYNFTDTAAATVNIAPYLEVVLMLDNSSSMDIAATTAGMNQLMTLSACDPSNAFYDNSSQPYTTYPQGWYNSAGSDNTYDDYATSANGVAFSGTTAGGTTSTGALSIITLSPAVTAPVSTTPFPSYVAGEYPTGTLTTADGSSFTPENSFPNYPTSAATGQTCQGVLPKQADGNYPIPGPPCAFACHWTNSTTWPNGGSDPRGGTADLWGLARRNQIQLRFDLVKNATQSVLKAMSQDNVSSINNLSVGIYTFNSTVTQVYPTGCTPGAYGCEAGTNFTAAETAVGLPPTYPSVTDTGIQPVVGARTGNNDDTAFPEAMNTLASTYVTTAVGNTGATAATPQKVLILVTDGFQDDPNTGARQAFDPSYCQQFKNMGYQVYVVYTPYYPIPHNAYMANNWASIVQSIGSSSIAYNLQACSSQSSYPSGNYFISAVDQTDLNNALLGFLKQALNSPARFSL